jgi:hypothetical protein
MTTTKNFPLNLTGMERGTLAQSIMRDIHNLRKSYKTMRELHDRASCVAIALDIETLNRVLVKLGWKEV